MESLLIIGSDEAALRKLKGHLIRRGFQVTSLELGGLARLEDGRERFSLCVLDATAQVRVTPLVDQLRAKPPCKELPLMVILKDTQLKELSLVGGLEDFLVAPVEPEALEARIRFVLKRLNHLAPGGGIQIGKLSLDVDRYEISLDGDPLELTYKEFELFKFLATHPGRVFSRDQLLNQVWGYDFIGGTRTVDVHIRRLRAKLGPKYASLIDTVRNVGYKFLESL